jgi:hypothetical protein
VLLVVVIVGSLFSRVAMVDEATPSGTGGRTVAYAAGFQFVLIALLGIVVQMITRLPKRPDGQPIVSGVTLATVALAAAILWPSALLWGGVRALRCRPLKGFAEFASHAILCIVAALATLLGSIWAASWGSAPPEGTTAVVLRQRVVRVSNADGSLEMQTIVWNEGDSDVWLAPDGHALEDASGADGDFYGDVALQSLDPMGGAAGPVSVHAHRSTLLRLAGRLVVKATGAPARGVMKELRGDLVLVRVGPQRESSTVIERIEWKAQADGTAPIIPPGSTSHRRATSLPSSPHAASTRP